MFFLASVFILLKQKQNVLLIVMGLELVTAVSAHYKLGLAQPKLELGFKYLIQAVPLNRNQVDKKALRWFNCQSASDDSCLSS